MREATFLRPTSPDDSPGFTFSTLGLREELLSTLAELGYEEPTPIQRLALPPLLEGKDVLGQAATGTGKTAAFALPLLQNIEVGACGPFEARALIVVPTRELAMQVAEAVHSYGKKLGVHVLPVYGGQDIGQQLRRLKRGVDVVIATPGRALDHVRRKSLKLGKVQLVVLDEADEMLDLGFAEDLEALLGEVPSGSQTALFSATLPPRIAALAEQHLNEPVRVRIEPEKTRPGSLPRIRQTAYVVPRTHKQLALGRILDVETPRSAIIFCRTRLEVEELTEHLAGHGHEAAGLHGGMTQEQRDRVLKKFKAHQLDLLVATDVAARGLDVEGLSHVINYDLPTSPEAYVHRIGRTGRAGKEGNAVSLVESRELRLLKNIERVTGLKVEQHQVPTVVDLRARRLALTQATVDERLAQGELDTYRSLVEQLSESADLLDVAAAAVAALHESLNPSREQDEAEIPTLRAAEPRPGKARSTSPREGARAPRPQARTNALGARIFVGLGRSAGLRPGDLVGAIANEAGLSAQEIGAIQIADHYAFVEVPEERAEHVLSTLRKSTLRGRKVKVDRDRRGQR